MENQFKTCFASVVDGLQQSDIYLTIKARLLETPKANLNGVRVTSDFINEIVANQDKYVGIPLCADVQSLANGDYRRLGHLYDDATGEFHSTQIGSFCKFEREDFENGAYLVGYARVMKRNKAVCSAITELFASGSLKFSFEISCGSCIKLDDGTLQIDASEDNYLEGIAVVSFPACEDAIALALIAECNNYGKDETAMFIEESVQQEIVAEDTEVETTVVEASEEVVAEESVTTENAEVEDRENECEETPCEEEKPEEEEEASCKKKCAEDAIDASIVELQNSDCDVSDFKFAEVKEAIAELKEIISAFIAEINSKNELNEQEDARIETAEAKFEEDFNAVGIVDEITLPTKTYSLLDKEEKSTTRTLLDRV